MKLCYCQYYFLLSSIIIANFAYLASINNFVIRLVVQVVASVLLKGGSLWVVRSPQSCPFNRCLLLVPQSQDLFSDKCPGVVALSPRCRCPLYSLSSEQHLKTSGVFLSPLWPYSIQVQNYQSILQLLNSSTVLNSPLKCYFVISTNRILLYISPHIICRLSRERAVTLKSAYQQR